METSDFRTNLLLRRLTRDFNNSFPSSPQNLTEIQLQDILIIAPHADDEVIGCGAAIDHFVRNGARVTVLIVTQESDRSIAKQYNYCPNERVEESYSAQSVLKYDHLVYFNFPELKLSKDSSLQEQYQQQLYDLIEKHKPDCVFMPNSKEMHPDHQVIGRLSREVISECCSRHTDWECLQLI